MRPFFRRSRAVLPLVAALAITAFPRAAGTETANVAAFARLFGVVRYFYPSDSAAAVDWNQFAIAGVRATRSAPDTASLQATLRQLVAPLGPGIEIAAQLSKSVTPARGQEPLVAWRYFGPGFSELANSPYRAKRTNRTLSSKPTINGFFTLMQSLPADSLRGRAIRLKGQVRATVQDDRGSAALWLRVDTESGRPGFFDNMGDRPVRSPEWREYGIEGTVAENATNVFFGVMAIGSVIADFDGIELMAHDPDGRWVPLPIKDAGFEAPTPEGWMRGGTTSSVAVTEPTPAPEGRQFVRIAPPPVTPVTAELFEDHPPSAGEHIDVDLGLGLRSRIPLVLTDVEAAASSTVPRAATPIASNDSIDQPDLDTRLADVVVAWNVYRHFYPYWGETAVDWESRLQVHLDAASAATTRRAELDVLRQLVADVRDGHGRVSDVRRGDRQSWLPIQVSLVEGRVVVSASKTPEVPVGSVVTAIDGVAASDRITSGMRLASGTTQWKTVRALQDAALAPSGSIVSLTIDTATGMREVRLTSDNNAPVPEPRPEQVTELTPGAWYVDLTRVPWAQLSPRLQTLSRAQTIVFDMRGYPTDAGSQILSHLIDAAESDRWMHVPKIVGPFDALAGWTDVGWNLKPASPHLSGKIVFMTDGRAISYAESVMGYVSSHHLGMIVGATTAGTNGNVATFTVPGGFSIAFTGMRVTQHDGTPHHLVGIQPDIAASPTIAGLRAGRDEVLERALAATRAAQN